APFDDTAATDAGAVYDFSADPSHPAVLVDPHAHAGDQFGASIAAMNGNILVGAPMDDAGGEDAGAAYLFHTTGAVVQTILDPGHTSGDMFGTSVAFAGVNVVVGAPAEGRGVSGAAVAYLFDPSGRLIVPLRSPAPTADDFFGVAVAGWNDVVVVGAPF